MPACSVQTGKPCEGTSTLGSRAFFAKILSITHCQIAASQQTRSNLLGVTSTRKPVSDDSRLTTLSRSIGAQAQREPAGGYAYEFIKNFQQSSNKTAFIQLG